MVEVKEVYKNKDYGFLVEVKQIESDYFIVYLGYRNLNADYNRIVLYQDKDKFLKNFEKLTSLEMELL